MWEVIGLDVVDRDHDVVCLLGLLVKVWLLVCCCMHVNLDTLKDLNEKRTIVCPIANVIPCPTFTLSGRKTLLNSDGP